MHIDNLVIIGCGGHARSVVDTIINLDIPPKILFWDINAENGEKIFGYDVSSSKKILSQSKNIFIAIGDNRQRADYFNNLNMCKNIINVMSNSAYISPEAVLGNGDFIGHGSYIGPIARIGSDTIINTNAVIEHESIIGKHSHISVNATICGRCNIGDFVFVGAAAVVRDRIKICPNTVIGAGSVVVKDILESGVYVGIPARKIRN